MWQYRAQRKPRNTVEVDLEFTWSFIEKNQERAITNLAKKLTLKGFRPGKIPLEIAKKNLKQEQIIQETLSLILPPAIQEIITKENLKIIANPQIKIVNFNDQSNWKFLVTFALKPEIVLPDYHQAIKKILLEEKKVDIWVPGKETKDKNQEEEKALKNQKTLSKILNYLLETIKVEIAEYVVNEEVEKRLAVLFDEIKSIGLTVEAYLKSKNQTADELRQSITKEIYDTLRLEFILEAIADNEKITVTQEEIDKLTASVKDDKEKERVKSNSYFIAGVIRKQKTLDFLLNL